MTSYGTAATADAAAGAGRSALNGCSVAMNLRLYTECSEPPNRYGGHREISHRDTESTERTLARRSRAEDTNSRSDERSLNSFHPTGCSCLHGRFAAAECFLCVLCAS